MLEWHPVFYSFLWILGLAGLLATISFVQWQAEQAGRAWLPALTQPRVRLLISAGFGLVGLGQALSAPTRWLTGGWGLLLLLALWTGILAWHDGLDRDRQR